MPLIMVEGLAACIHLDFRCLYLWVGVTPGREASQGKATSHPSLQTGHVADYLCLVSAEARSSKKNCSIPLFSAKGSECSVA